MMASAVRAVGSGRFAAALKRSVSSPLDVVLTVVVAAIIVALAFPLVRWAFLDAVWTGTAETCRAAGGACWAFVRQKLEFIMFGLYPPAERWRAGLAVAVMVGLTMLTAWPRAWRRRLIVAWAVGLALAFWLMRGGAGLTPVPSRLWGGLPITLSLTAVGLALGFPLAILLALGRRSSMALPRMVCTAFVEIDKLFLAQGAVIVFASAYLAEAVRSGLQMVPRGQRDAARALGLGTWQVNRLVILPQALRIVVPSFVSIAVGFFQDTSLVVIIGLFDLLNTARVAAQDPQWLGFHTEAFVFVGLLYFLGSTITSQYGLWLERRNQTGPSTGTVA